MRGVLRSPVVGPLQRSLGARATPSSGLGHGYLLGGLLRPHRWKTLPPEPQLM